MIKLSIIIPVYNIDSWLLERCLESIAKQGLEKADFEIIIIDDGSNTKIDITERVKTLLPIQIIHQKNKGLGGARNTGIQLAKGEYLVFIDSDDYLFANRLKPLLERCLDQHLDCIIFSHNKVNSEYIDIPKTKYNQIIFKGSGAEYMLRHNVLGVCWQLYRTSLLQLNNDLVFVEHIYHEDELFVPLWLMRVKLLEVTNSEVYAYYNRACSITNSFDSFSIDKRRKDFLFVINTLEATRQNRSLSALQSKALQRRITYLTADYIINGLRSTSISEVRKIHINNLRLAHLFPIKNLAGENKLKIFSLFSRCYLGLWLIKHIDKLR